jgi:hypothetical protein
MGWLPDSIPHVIVTLASASSFCQLPGECLTSIRHENGMQEARTPHNDVSSNILSDPQGVLN